MFTEMSFMLPWKRFEAASPFLSPFFPCGQTCPKIKIRRRLPHHCSPYIGYPNDTLLLVTFLTYLFGFSTKVAMDQA
jgi:hypothetical protein